MKYQINQAPKKKWLRKAVSRLFWGAVFGVDFLAITLFITMYFNNYSVFWLLWNTISVVWQSALVGAMLGLSFDFNYQNLLKIKKHLAATRAFHRLQLELSLSKLSHAVKAIRGDNKNVRI
jgi:hypothetical protein